MCNGINNNNGTNYSTLQRGNVTQSHSPSGGSEVRLLKKLAVFACFTAGMFLCLYFFPAILAKAGLSVLIATLAPSAFVAALLAFRSGGKPPPSGVSSFHFNSRLVLYPSPGEARLERSQYGRALIALGFAPIGRYDVYETDLFGPRRTELQIDGYVNVAAKTYASVHLPESGKPWLELTAPCGDGMSLTFTDADRDVSAFSVQPPGQPTVSKPGLSPSALFDLLLETHKDPDPGDVSAKAYRDYYVAQEAARRAWLSEGMAESNRLIVRGIDQAMDQGLLRADSVGRAVAVHDRMPLYQVKFLLTLHRLWYFVKSETTSAAWADLTPRQMFDHILKNPRKGRAALTYLGTIGDETPTDVYLAD